ncbi:NADH:flavin oxidoreductase / NADH oxidase family protein [Desulfocicer vacuolatum DSM 3385]|uniref:NADH:flavin oxidoreductase / NADH oxidase family protein n=1 Tax=Desulfocicer vacuolatum DSM 3385 TaxID=1121400 RepID=A0A1W2CYZ7_9BACT|nr:NADH:flavin oxidoreductase [Desulfocicer vacuolatum]SMC90094.1 NADH:flavin oxidoreductase / NADH oxidase family protein [Desulfocicer vacuolatum DSM 3385]
MNHAALFKPIQIGDIEIKNRIAMAPMNVGYTGPNGYPSEQSLAWYAMRARGGFGLIMTECVVMNPHRWAGHEALNPPLLIDERYYRFHSELTETIHQYSGCKLCLQLSPGWGRQGHPHVNSKDCPAGAPSAIPLEVDMRKLNQGWIKQIKRIAPEASTLLPDLETLQGMKGDEYIAFKNLVVDYMADKFPEMLHLICGDTPRELTKAEIVDLEDRFAVQAQAAFKLGYDAIEIHAPHGYLLHQFLSPRSNKRHDEYGGTINNRVRFLSNIIIKTREKIGHDKAFGVRLSGDELMPGGIPHDEVKKVIGLCKDAGANFFNISQGSAENPGAAFAPDGEGEFTQWAPGFKQASGGMPVITPSFINPETAEKAILSGETDIISLGRQAIADPFWPVKVKEGRVEDIVKCKRCQRCFMDLMTSNWLRCSVNPIVGREKMYPELFLDTPKLTKKIKQFKEKIKNLPQI